MALKVKNRGKFSWKSLEINSSGPINRGTQTSPETPPEKTEVGTTIANHAVRNFSCFERSHYPQINQKLLSPQPCYSARAKNLAPPLNVPRHSKRANKIAGSEAWITRYLKHKAQSNQARHWDNLVVQCISVLSRHLNFCL